LTIPVHFRYFSDIQYIHIYIYICVDPRGSHTIWGRKK
jgi:hypothetical protein